MSFYVGPERFEPTQRDAQWRNRCSAEVQSYAKYRNDGGPPTGRGRDPILGVDDGNKTEKFVVVPNPEKIGALNAPKPEPWEPASALAAQKKQPKEGNPAVQEADRVDGMPAAAAMRAAVAAGNAMNVQDQLKVRFSPPASDAGSRTGSARGGKTGKRPGTGNSEGSTLSGDGSSIVSSSAYRNCRGAGPRGAIVDAKLSSTGGRSGEFARTASAGSSSVSTGSTKSSVLYEALGEETKRRVEAEKEVARLTAILEERPH